jgi:hypothetical protein
LQTESETGRLLIRRRFSCTVCDGPMEEQVINFRKDDKVWRLTILLCKNEKCMEKRGGTWVPYQTEQRANRGK